MASVKLSHILLNTHDDVIIWKHFEHYWPFVQGIHQSTENSPPKGQWHGALMFSLICAWTNSWIKNRCWWFHMPSCSLWCHCNVTCYRILRDLNSHFELFLNTYELLNLRALKFSPVNKIHIFQWIGKIFCVEFQRYPMKLHTKYLTHTLKYMICIQHWNFKSS